MTSRRQLNAGLAAALASLSGLLPALAADMPAPAGKRVGPPDVAPVVVGDVRIEVVDWARDRGFVQDGGVIAAVDAKSGKELWTLLVYTTTFDPKMERDVQDVFIAGLEANDNGVIVTDEHGRRFRVDIATRKVTAL